MTDPSTIVDITTAILVDSILAADPNAITTFLALDLEMGDARHIRRPDLAEFVTTNSLGTPYTDGTAELHSSVRDWIVVNLRRSNDNQRTDAQLLDGVLGRPGFGKTQIVDEGTER